MHGLRWWGEERCRRGAAPRGRPAEGRLAVSGPAPGDRAAGAVADAAPGDRLVVEGYVDDVTGRQLSNLIRRIHRSVVIDLSAVSGFDSAGLDLLLAAQEDAPARVRLEGIVDATARLVLADAVARLELATPPTGQLAVTRLGRTCVVTVRAAAPDPDALATALRSVGEPAEPGPRPATVVIDLIGAAELDRSGERVVTRCAGELAGRGLDLLVVNAPPAAGAALALAAPQIRVHTRPD